MTAISENAKKGFDHMLVQGVKAGFCASGGSMDFVVLPDNKAFTGNRIVILTASSYLFRLFVLVYVTPDQLAKEYFAGLRNIQNPEMAESALMDTICEAGNMCVGALNRDMSKIFPHIGLSTPNIIDKHCGDYLHSLKCGHIQHFEISIDQKYTFHVSLCVSQYDNIDFSVDTTEVESTGELEMF